MECIEETGPAEAHETLMDHPVSFGDGKSSGPDVRRFAARYVRRKPALLDVVPLPPDSRHSR
jgi:hypothetical protein